MATTLRPAPGPRSFVPGKYAVALRRDGLAFLTAVARDFGDVARFRVGRETIHLVSHPDHVRDVLVTHQKKFKKGRALERAKLLLGEGLLTSEGEFHLRQRRLMQPAFHKQRIAAYGDTMARFAVRRASSWHDGPMDVHAEMMALTLAIVGKTLFDADVEGEAAEIGRALGDAFSAFNFSIFFPFSELLEKLPIPPARRFRAGRARLDETVYRIIRERRASGRDTGDLLSMLLAARDEEGDGSGMTDAQVRDESMTLFLAGHETTAVALSWTWHLLAQHPQVEAALHAEVDALDPRTLSADDLPRLEYTRRVLTESMRLYPPAWAIGRRALEACVLGDFLVPAGAIVLLSPYITQRDARWFPEPLRFDPDRWLVPSERPKFAYFPFGGGPRLCIGEPFAWMEGVLLLAEIARRWRFRRTNGLEVVPQPIVTLRPRGGMPMVAERRAAVAAGSHTG